MARRKGETMPKRSNAKKGGRNELVDIAYYDILSSTCNKTTFEGKVGDMTLNSHMQVGNELQTQVD